MCAHFGGYKIIQSHLLLVLLLPQAQADGGISSPTYYKVKIIGGWGVCWSQYKTCPNHSYAYFCGSDGYHHLCPPSFLLSPIRRHQWLESDCFFKQLPIPDPSPFSVWLEHGMRSNERRGEKG